jgi:hypothetical protein
MAINIPNGRKIYQHFPFQGPPKFTQFEIFGFRGFFSLDPEHSVISQLEVCCTEMRHLVQAVKAYSNESGLRVRAWPPDPDSDDFAFDVGVVASFGHLIHEKIIDAFPQ